MWIAVSKSRHQIAITLTYPSFRTGEYNFRTVKKSLEALSPDVMLICQCSIEKGIGNFFSHLTKRKSIAGDTTFMRFNGKKVHVVHAFHPSILTKYRSQTGADNTETGLNEVLLLFCFMLALNLTENTDVIRDGLKKLRAQMERMAQRKKNFC
jgi:hypothetical protein